MGGCLPAEPGAVKSYAAAPTAAKPDAMRSWVFHPLVFYPLAFILAVLAITVSLKPQAWPREPAPVAAANRQGVLVFSGAAFDSPEGGPDQNFTVSRDYWGRPQALRIAVHPDTPPPTPADRGVRLLLTPQDAAALEGRPLRVEVSYNALPVNQAHGLAVSVQGAGQTAWVSQDLPTQNATIRFDLPAQSNVNALGLRALNEGAEEAFGLEITRIRVTPRA
jgi:hypothetical protein